MKISFSFGITSAQISMNKTEKKKQNKDIMVEDVCAGADSK